MFVCVCARALELLRKHAAKKHQLCGATLMSSQRRISQSSPWSPQRLSMGSSSPKPKMPLLLQPHQQPHQLDLLFLEGAPALIQIAWIGTSFCLLSLPSALFLGLLWIIKLYDRIRQYMINYWLICTQNISQGFIKRHDRYDKFVAGSAALMIFHIKKWLIQDQRMWTFILPSGKST